MQKLEECCKNIDDAKREWMFAVLEDGGVIPEPKRLVASKLNKHFID